MQKSKIKNHKFFQHFAFCFVIFIFEFCNLNLSFAKDISFEVTVDKNKVSLGESIQLNLSFYGTQEVPTPYFPDIEGFKAQYLGPSTRMSIINGRVSSSITHRYRLVPLRTGNLEIPSFSIQFRGKTYTSEPISIEVVQGPLSAPFTAQKPQPQIQDLEDMVFVIMQIDKKSAYVNELIPLTIKLYATALTLRDIQYPEFSHEGFSVDEFAQPKQYQEVLNGISYNVIEFNTNIFALRPGKLRLGPAQIKCNLLVKKKLKRPRFSLFDDDFFGPDIFDDFFGRYESYPLTLSSIDLPITIMDLPQENRPEEFSGALGNYNFYLEATPREVKVGDPITLRMIITGEGNFKTVKPPALKFADGFKVYEPETEKEQGKKIFEQVIIPKNAQLQEIPEISFSFFDPKSGKYKTITRGPLSIKVEPLAPGEKLQVFAPAEEGRIALPRKELLGRDIIYIKDSPGRLKRKGEYLCRSKIFIMFMLIPALAVVSVLILEKRRQRLAHDIVYARRLRAPRKARKNLVMVESLVAARKPKEFFNAVFKTLQEYLGDKFHLPSAGITSEVVEELRKRNIESSTLNKLRECFENCDTARYAPASITEEMMHQTFRLLREVIDELERVKMAQAK